MRTHIIVGTLYCALAPYSACAAISLDRTRIIYDGGEKSLSLNVSNDNQQLPYLAQGWLEDDKGNKVTSPLMVLPPIQRIEAGAKSQIKVQGLPAAKALPQDRESLFYFNLREIPPRSDKPNTLQVALQTRIKLFYRPKSLMLTPTAMATSPWQEKLTLTRQGDKYLVNNPTAYYTTLVDGSRSAEGQPAKDFEPLMLAPFSKGSLKSGSAELGNNPVLTYINDYGARPQLQFTCSGGSCQAKPVKTTR